VAIVFRRNSCLVNSIFTFYQTAMWHTKGVFRTLRFVQPLLLKILLGAASLFAATGALRAASPFPSSGPTVPGSIARLRYGHACAPERAPVAVKRAIWAGNQLCSKPYHFGGGHRSFDDKGYDCSGTVSYVLGGAGLIKSPMNSSDLRAFGQRGRGKWITIYARNGHAFAVIAGLRLDTTPWDNSSDRWAPRWQSTDRKPFGFQARHPVGL
jgi:hypothetical protein